MKNETSIENSKHLINNSSLITAENSSKHSKFNNIKRNIGLIYNKKYSNTALFENPRRDFSNSITQRRTKKGVYITDLTISKYRDMKLDTKTTLESTNICYTNSNKFTKHKTPKGQNKNVFPTITAGFTKYSNNPPDFNCCDLNLNTHFLTQLYYRQNLHSRDEQNRGIKSRNKLKEDRNLFLRKTNEIKRLKYELNLKKEAMEDFKENIKMQKCGIDFTINSLKTYRNTLENDFLAKYNDNMRKLERELFEHKLKSDEQNDELNRLMKDVSSLKLSLVKKENILKNIEKWLHLQISIKEGTETKNIKSALKKYNNKLIFETFEELKNCLTHKENNNIRLMEKYNKAEKEKNKLNVELLEQEKDFENMDKTIDLLIIQKENILIGLKKKEKDLIKTLNDVKSLYNINKKSQSLKNLKTSINIKEELKKNELDIFYKPITTKNDLLKYIDCIYIGIVANNLNGFTINQKYITLINNVNISQNAKAVAQMKIIEIALNYLISSINKKIVTDKNCFNIMEKTCKIIDLYHKKVNGSKNRMELQKKRENLMKKIENKNNKAYYLPKGKIEKYNVAAIEKKKKEERLKNKKVVKKIDIWDFLYDQKIDEKNNSDEDEK